MTKAAEFYIFYFLKVAGGVFALLLTSIFLMPTVKFYALILGYALSFIFVGSNLLVLRKIDLADHQAFMRIFFGSMVLRFALAVVSITFVLKVVNIHQIFFTVSFIISYIFHSVIEIIFINKILETDN